MKRTIIWKLFTVFVLAGFAGALVIGGYFRMAFHPSNHAMGPAAQNLNQYADYLLKDIGNPPSPEKAKELAKKLSMGIRISGLTDSKLDFATDEEVPSWAALEANAHFRHGDFGSARNLRVGRYQKYPFIIFERDGRRVMMMVRVRGPMDDGSGFPIEAAIFLLVGLLAVFFGLFWLVRRMLRPLIVLNRAVHEAGQGKLGISVPVHSRDEIGRLSQSFNEMSKSLKAMLQSREQLLWDVSHELRTPLTRIRLGLEMLKSGSDSAAAGESIREDVTQLDLLIQRVLDYSKFESSAERKRIQISSEEFIRETLKSFTESEKSRIVAPSSASVSFEFQGELFWLSRALRNILENALKYGRGKPAHLEVYTDGAQVVIAVRDEGHGIAEADLEKIFDPFFRADVSRNKEIEGFGLGLSLTKRVVDSGGGAVIVKSTVGQGTRVELRFRKV